MKKNINEKIKYIIEIDNNEEKYLNILIFLLINKNK